jgi:hypothetical protein
MAVQGIEIRIKGSINREKERIWSFKDSDDDLLKQRNIFRDEIF